jgi:hypothetical protein
MDMPVSDQRSRSRVKIITTCILAAFLLQADFSRAGPLKAFGVKAGSTTATQNWKYFDQAPEFRTGDLQAFTVGVFAEWVDSPFFTIRTAVDYQPKGMQASYVIEPEGPPYNQSSQTITLDNRVDFLSLALFTDFKHEIGPVTPYLLAGPRLDLKIGQQIAPEFEDVADDFKSPLFGWSWGFGLQIKGLILVEYQQDVDVTNILDHPDLVVKGESHSWRAGVRF